MSSDNVGVQRRITERLPKAVYVHCSDRKSKDDAAALLASLATFDFIVSFLVLYEFLSHLSGVTVKLQGQSTDIIKAYQEVGVLKGMLFF